MTEFLAMLAAGVLGNAIFVVWAHVRLSQLGAEIAAVSDRSWRADDNGASKADISAT